MKKKELVKIILFVLIVILCVWFLWSRSTYTSYESLIAGEMKADVAGWNISINNNNLRNLSEDRKLTLSDISWTNENVRDGKVSLGSIGKLNINVDATNTDVSVRYDLVIVDKSVDSNKILKLRSVTSNNSTIVKTNSDTYTTVLTKDDIKNGVVPHIVVEVEWENDDVEVDYNATNVNEDFLYIDFNAIQYKGETIEPFEG